MKTLACLLILACTCDVWGRQAAGQLAEPPAQFAPEAEVHYTYVLGPDDQITIWALGVTEIDGKPIRIGPGGQIDLPLIGLVEVSGLTVEQLKAHLLLRLKDYVREPQVTVSVLEMRSQPVSILGPVKNPGVHLLHGNKTLVEVLALAGGLQPEAGPIIKITRRLAWGPIPLPGATEDPTGTFSVAEMSLKAVMESGNPEYNIVMRPHDVVSIPKASMVYVMGEVSRPGGYALSERETMSVLQTLSLAGGINRGAAHKRARILRVAPGARERQEILVDLEKMLAGNSADMSLQPEDILFIPNSTGKTVSVKAIETAIQLGLGIAVFRR
jgi:polysaccharide export outer membrane protein